MKDRVTIIDNTLSSFLSWKEKQHKIIRCGKVMYDVKGHYRYLNEHELFDYWSTIKNKNIN